MANREITYYSLLSSENLRHIEDVADNTSEKTFIGLGFDKKWFHHLWIGANNEAFIEWINHQTDLKKLDKILSEQLKLYARKQGEGYEKDNNDFQKVYEARKDWLKHTIFICQNEFGKTKKEIFNEAIKWCKEWESDYLETFKPVKEDDRIVFYSKGKRQMSGWEFMSKSGLIDRMAKKGMTINPTHDYELLKPVRKGLYDKAKDNFIKERTLDKLQTTEIEINYFYISWLNNELKVIEQWLSDKYPNGKKKTIKTSNSNQIEILKYQQFVLSEIEKAEQENNRNTVLKDEEKFEASKEWFEERVGVLIDKDLISEFVNNEIRRTNNVIKDYLSPKVNLKEVSNLEYLQEAQKYLSYVKQYKTENLEQENIKQNVLNPFSEIDNEFNNLNESLFQLLNESPLPTDLETKVKNWINNAKLIISNYLDKHSNDNSIQFELKQRTNFLIQLINQLSKTAFDTPYKPEANKPKLIMPLFVFNSSMELMKFTVFINQLLNGNESNQNNNSANNYRALLDNRESLNEVFENNQNTLEAIKNNINRLKEKAESGVLNASESLAVEYKKEAESKREIKRIEKQIKDNEKEIKIVEVSQNSELKLKSNTNKTKTKKDVSKNLESFFESISKYKTIMELLVTKNLVYPNTYIWKDEEKGNKAYLVGIIKDFHGKKYYKDNQRPTGEQIKLICKNTFGLEVSIHTIKRAKADNFNLDFIPYATTID